MKEPSNRPNITSTTGSIGFQLVVQLIPVQELVKLVQEKKNSPFKFLLLFCQVVVFYMPLHSTDMIANVRVCYIYITDLCVTFCLGDCQLISI